MWPLPCASLRACRTGIIQRCEEIDSFTRSCGCYAWESCVASAKCVVRMPRSDREESAQDAEELAREEERARNAAQLQARQASLADRLAERGIHPSR